MKKILSFTPTLLIFLTLVLLPNAFAQGTLFQSRVSLIYFLPKDRPVRPDRITALQELIEDTQTFFADEMERHGFSRKTFTLETDSKGEPVVHQINGRFNDAHYRRQRISTVWDEVKEQFNSPQGLYFVAIDINSEMDVPWCGMGVGYHRKYGRGALIHASGRCFDLPLAAHELGHAFALEHDFREPVHIMSYSGRRHQLSKCAAAWLDAHVFFNNASAQVNRDASIQMLSPTAVPNGIRLRFEVADADGLHQAMLYLKPTPADPAQDFKLDGCQLLDTERDTIEFVTSELIDPFQDEVTLQVIDKHGGIKRQTFPINIASLLPRPKVVSVPDRNLAAAVRKAAGLTPNARITDQAMQRLTRLEARRSDIKNLTGLEHATLLTELFLNENQIRNINPLTGLTRLKRLDVDANQISDLSPLAGLTQLEKLYIRNNSIRDIRPLAGLTQLTDLKLYGNPIQDKSPLRTLKTRNPKLEIDIPLSAVVHIDPAQRPSLYWVDATTGTLHRLVGDEVENLVPTVKNATSLAVDIVGGKLYWTEKTGERTGRIRGANFDGTNVKLVKDLTSVPHSIAIDAANGKLYLTNAWGKVQCLNVDGSNFQPNLITNLNAPKHITLDVVGSQVYWTETTEGFGRIRRANLDGSSVQNVVTNLTEPLSLVVINGKLYWTNGTRENKGELQRANLDGTNRGALETLPIAPTSIALDPARNSLYLTSPSGGIYRRNLDDIVYQPIVTGLVSPSTIALGISATPPVPTDTPTPPTEPGGDTAADVNQDKKINKTDLLLVVTALGESPPANPNFDVNADGTVDIADVLLVIEALDDPVAAAAPSFGETLTALDPGQLAMQIDILRAESDGSMKYEHAIAFFQGLLASIRPPETQLFANYPNPFNPETWIPYQLAKASDVKVTIYDGRGVVVRQLVLGHQASGFYTGRDRAAYWDGRNALSEPVASGVYFYTLTAGEFTATRKLLIRK